MKVSLKGSLPTMCPCLKSPANKGGVKPLRDTLLLIRQKYLRIPLV